MLRAWLAIGSQSLGGGSSAIYLMRVIFVERKAWMAQREFLEDWALSRLSPGIHMVALAGLLGRRLGGAVGAVVSVCGFMLPSGIITATMTAAYVLVRDQPAVTRALAGMAPVALGLTLGMNFVFVRTSRRSGHRGMLDMGAAAAAVIAGVLAPSQTYAVIVAGVILGALLLGGERSGKSETPVQ